MSTKKFLDLNGLSRVWDKAENKYSKKILSIRSAYGVSSSSSTLPTRWTLPAEYQEIEYLQSTATEWIDTGVDAFDVRKIECKFATMSKGASQYITGARSTSPNVILFAIDGSALNKKFSGVYNGNILMTSDIDRENGVIVNAILEISDAVEGKRTMTFKCNDGTYDETNTQSNVNDVEITGYTVGIFGWNSYNKTAIRLYREKIYTDSGLVRDYVPCLNKTTGKYGLYDMVNSQFYTSAVDFTLYGNDTTYIPQLTSDTPYMWEQDVIEYADGTTQKKLPYVIEQKSEGGSGDTPDYNDLPNKPQINSVTLTGNKSLSDLGIAAANGVINATDLTVTNGAVNLVDYVNTPGIYKVPSDCWIYTDSTSSTANRIYALAGDIVKIEPQIDAGDGEELVEFDSYFTVFGSTVFAGAMVTADNVTWTSIIASYENQGNKVTTISSSSRNTQYPSAKAVYDYAASKSLYSDTTINTGRDTSSTTGGWSTAIGLENTASGQCAVSEGEACIASGEAAHAGGIDSTASGAMSVAFGEGAQANGETSFALGTNVKAQRKNQLVVGRYNAEDTTGSSGSSLGSYAEIVGNGTGSSNRSNARTTDWAGNGWYAGNIKVGGTGYSDSNAKELATKDYIDSLVVEGAKKTILYNGKASSTAVLSGAIQQLSDSIYNYDMILVGFNCMVQNFGRSMEICDTIYPNNALIDWCDTTGAGASGAHHIYNSNQAHNNLYRIIWGFTDETHIRNIVSAHVNTGTYGWVDEGICYVVGYKFSSLPDGYATEQYVDNAIASAVTSAIGGSY